MKKHLFKGKTILFSALIISIVLAGISITYGVIAEPGSEQDPVVTLSYIEQVFMPKAYEYIDKNVVELKGIVEGFKTSLNGIEDRMYNIEKQGKSEFRVVSIKSGQQFFGSAGTEIILRMGTATIISSEKGGLSDVTVGKDISIGEAMPDNHLLIIPLGDGRGFAATKDVIVMVKGSYEIK
jgi:hypothetical protein